jgi:L-ascorbate metabolism protein UlaG (beta-lactamase superfamily)
MAENLNLMRYPLLAAAAPALILAWLAAHAGEFDPLKIERQADGTTSLLLEAAAGSLQRLEYSADLQTWQPMISLEMPAAGTVELLDTTASGEPSRFYRSTPLLDGSLTGDHLATTAGDVLIHPVEHASFVMQWDGKTIYNDPVGGAPAFAGIPKADLVLIGHRHRDHWSSSTVNDIIRAETVFVAPLDVHNQMSLPFKERTTVLANGESTDLLGLKITAIPAYNSNHPQGRDNGYIVTIGGRRLYMSGDTGDIAEMRALENIDVAFVAMNIPYTMSVDQAASAIREFQPAVVYPYHYRNGDGSFADFGRLQTLLGDDLPIELRLRDWY